MFHQCICLGCKLSDPLHSIGSIFQGRTLNKHCCCTTGHGLPNQIRDTRKTRDVETWGPGTSLGPLAGMQNNPEQLHFVWPRSYIPAHTLPRNPTDPVSCIWERRWSNQHEATQKISYLLSECESSQGAVVLFGEHSHNTCVVNQVHQFYRKCSLAETSTKRAARRIKRQEHTWHMNQETTQEEHQQQQQVQDQKQTQLETQNPQEKQKQHGKQEQEENNSNNNNKTERKPARQPKNKQTKKQGNKKRTEETKKKEAGKQKTSKKQNNKDRHREIQIIQTHRNTETNTETNTQTNTKTNKETSKQGSKQASKQRNYQTNNATETKENTTSRQTTSNKPTTR